MRKGIIKRCNEQCSSLFFLTEFSKKSTLEQNLLCELNGAAKSFSFVPLLFLLREGKEILFSKQVGKNESNI